MKSTADFKMFFLEGTELFFPDILFDTAFLINFICRPRWWHDCVKIDASIILDAKYDQRLRESGMLQATGYPAEIPDFYSAISAGY